MKCFLLWRGGAIFSSSLRSKFRRSLVLAKEPDSSNLGMKLLMRWESSGVKSNRVPILDLETTWMVMLSWLSAQEFTGLGREIRSTRLYNTLPRQHPNAVVQVGEVRSQSGEEFVLFQNTTIAIILDYLMYHPFQVRGSTSLKCRSLMNIDRSVRFFQILTVFLGSTFPNFEVREKYRDMNL